LLRKNSDVLTSYILLDAGTRFAQKGFLVPKGRSRLLRSRSRLAKIPTPSTPSLIINLRLGLELLPSAPKRSDGPRFSIILNKLIAYNHFTSRKNFRNFFFLPPLPTTSTTLTFSSNINLCCLNRIVR
jgi:hypothetical protein